MMNSAKQSPILIFSDLDGTLLDTRTYTLSQEVIDFLREIRAVTLVLVTSRAWDGVVDYCSTLELVHPQIVENGALIIDPVTNKIIYHQPLSKSALDSLKELSIRRKLPISFATPYQTYNSIETLPETELSIGRISLIVREEHASEVRGELANLKSINFVMDKQANSRKKCLVDITPIGVDKMVGVRQWLQMNGAAERMYVVGNSLNDLPMFKEEKIKFTKVAIENGAEELKERADLIILSPRQGGFLRLLHSLSPSSL
jgi:HAD superfamily hydrolase (TIGR01484 family)